MGQLSFNYEVDLYDVKPFSFVCLWHLIMTLKQAIILCNCEAEHDENMRKPITSDHVKGIPLIIGVAFISKQRTCRWQLPKAFNVIYIQPSLSSLMSGTKSIQVVTKRAGQSKAKTLMDSFDHTRLPSWVKWFDFARAKAQKCRSNLPTLLDFQW